MSQLFSVRGNTTEVSLPSLIVDGLKPCCREGFFYWKFQGDELAMDFVSWRVINMIATDSYGASTVKNSLC